MVCIDAFSSRGRKRSEDHLPNLLIDITARVDSQSQADPQFRTTRLYTHLRAAEVRRQLIGKFGYIEEELPTDETIATKLNKLNASMLNLRDIQAGIELSAMQVKEDKAPLATFIPDLAAL